MIPLALNHEWTDRSRKHYLGTNARGRKRFRVVSGGLMNFRHSDGRWDEIVEDAEVADDGIHRWRLRRVPYDLRVGRRFNWAIRPDRNNPNEYIEVGPPAEIDVDSNGWIEGKGYRWNGADFGIAMDFRPTGVKVTYRIKRDLGLNSLTIPFRRTGVSRVRALKMMSGLVVRDAAGEERSVGVDFIDADHVRLSFDPVGLTFPIDVDPTLDIDVAATNDNGRHSATSHFFDKIDIISVGLFDNAFGLWTGWARFQVPIPKDAIIDTAEWLLTASTTGGQFGSLIIGDIHTEDVDDAAQIIDDTDFHTRSLSPGSVPWSMAVPAPGGLVTSPEIKTLIQTRVNSAGWVSNNYIQPIFNTDAVTALFNLAQFITFDRSAQGAIPRLHIEYTVGPDAPANPAATPGIEKNTVTWDNVVGATSFNLYWLETSPVTQGTGNQITGVTSPFEHTGRTPGAEVFYVVTAVDAGANESADSAEVSATPTAVPAPSNPVAAAGVEQNTISWEDVPEASSFNIYWALTPGVTQATGTPIIGVTSPHEHTGLIVGQPYFYIITSVSLTESADSAEVSATPLPVPPAHLPRLCADPVLAPVLNAIPVLPSVLNAKPELNPTLNAEPEIDDGC